MEWREKKPIYDYDFLHDDITTILSNIHGIDDVDRFLNPNIDELNNPYTLKNIEKARDRIDKAINEDEKISIYADIDPDGIFSTVTIFSYLKNFTDNVEIFHAQRSAGHGIFFGKDMIPDDTKLLIIVDSSSNDVEVCKQIQYQNIDIVILDHHQISKINNNCILVNPQQEGCCYPNKNSCGTLITWQICRALDDLYQTKFSESYINFVAIATVSDMMSMMELENRYLVREGLKPEHINNEGLKHLFQMMNVNTSDLSTTSIAFNITSSLNAVCRFDRIELAFKLLLSDNGFETYSLAQQIVNMNEQRKKEQARFKQLLTPRINNEDKGVVLIENSIGAGFKGLIAGDICNDLHKPVIVLSENEDYVSGSYRSFNNYDLQTFLRSIPEIEYAEGHPQAGGCKMKIKDVDKVIEYFNDHFEQTEEDQFLEYVMELKLSDLNEPFVRDVQEFYKYNGEHFKTGLFKLLNIPITNRRVMGKSNNTIKLESNKNLNIMKFRTTEDYLEKNIVGKTIDVIGELNLNVFRETTSIQLFLEDYRITN